MTIQTSKWLSPIFLFCFALPVAHAQTIPASERAALIAIYNQTGGPNWTKSTNWFGPAGMECSWYGVSCNSTYDHVTSFVLTYNNLVGTLPSLDGLPALDTFWVEGNQLSGSIPPISGLANLRFFNVKTNHLSGAIPSPSGLSNLQYFVVANNQLTGGIPLLSGLPSLTDLDASANHLTGTVPQLAGLTNLTNANVGSNQLTGSLPALTGLYKLATFYADRNQLSGAIPSLADLRNLQLFHAEFNRLTGAIPTLSGLSNLQAFDVTYNQLSGPVPSLAGLSNLQLFHVELNQLGGSFPDLTGLASLQTFRIGSNGISGNIGTAPQSLLAGQSSLCNNPLNHLANSAWDAATGQSPWYGGCVSSPTLLTIATTDTAVATGTKTTITASVAAGKALLAGSIGTVTVTDDKGNVVCYIQLDSTGHGSCDAILPSGTSNLLAGYSGTANLAPTSTQFSKTTPITVSGNLDQHGWTGTWYNPATTGQGIVFEIYPDLFSIGTGLFGGGWFTFDTTAGGEEKKRWYTLSGPVSSASTTATLDIISPTGGNFNAAPVINSGDGANNVGHAVIHFTDCTHGNLSYSFTDGSGRVGNIPLTRLDTNVTCDPINGAGNGTAPGKFLLSGAWYTAATSGQGIIFDINPLQNITAAAWYTYAPNGQSIEGGASQRWYTLQIGSANVGAVVLNNIGIYSAQGGLFDAPGSVTTPQVGSASITFSSCNSMALSYSFTAGTNAGLNGSINLQRVGPTPAGCSL